MSEVEAQRRFRWIAMGFAAIAMVLAIVAVVVVLGRGKDSDVSTKATAKPAKVAVDPISDVKVLATDVVKLQRENVELVVENGETKGLRIKDIGLEKLLGLQPGDVLTALSGRPLGREMDIHDAVFNASMMSATTLYAEVIRDGTPTLVRWKLDGDLRQARYGATGSLFNSYGSYTSPYGAPSAPPAPDPVLDTIERLDNTHATLPRKTADHILADLAVTAKGARVVPSIKNGQPDGMKLYAIRPSSVFARLNFTNGDTVHAINGLVLSSPDKVLEAYGKLKGADELTFEVTRRGRPVTLTVTITK